MPDAEKIMNGDRRALAKAITLIESSKAEDQKAASELLAKLKPSKEVLKVGVTGSPGVGKSTLIEALGMHLVKDNKVAVLAVDPSSPISGGSILGDKTRMEKLAAQDNAFIRPSPTAGALGGVASKTKEVIELCAAANFDIILVETVGVGQSEVEVAKMVDVFLLLVLPNAGDEVQGIKRGIMELADFIVINKADGENLQLAEQAKAQYQSSLQLLGKQPKQVHICSALNGIGIEQLWSAVKSFKS